MRIFPLLLLACALCACAPITAPPTPILPTMTPTSNVVGQVAARLRNATPTPQATAAVTTTAAITQGIDVDAPEVIAAIQTRHEICLSDATSAQQVEALKEPQAYLNGRTVALTGDVWDVRDLNPGYDAIIELDHNEAQARIFLEREQALSFERGDYVLLSGEYVANGCFVYDEIVGTLTLLKRYD